MEITRYFAKDLLAGKTVFVTGGGSGINLGVARNFAAVGANVAICGRTQERLDGAAKELEALGARVLAKAADVRQMPALQAAIDETRSALGPIDVLVCGAAGNFLCRAEDMSPNGFRTVVEIDLIGSFNAARAAFAQLKERRGTILFVSAGMAYMPYAFQVHVGAAKAGIEQMMQNLALEWGHYRHPLLLHRAGTDRRHRGHEAPLRLEGPGGAPRPHPHAAAGHGRRHRPGGRVPGLADGELHHRRAAGRGRRQRAGRLGVLQHRRREGAALQLMVKGPATPDRSRSAPQPLRLETIAAPSAPTP